MTKTRKRTEVTIETERQVVWRRASGSERTWCHDCAAETFMFTPDAAGIVAGLALERIYERIESGALHFKELPDGTQLVCALSLGLSRA